MEKKTLRAVMAALLMAAIPAYAGSYAVTADQAKAMVQSWTAENRGGFGLGGATVAAVAPFADADGTLLWYAVTLDNGACVFVSPDTRLEPVIAVVPRCNGVLPAANPLRGMMTADIRARLRAVAASKAGLQSVSPAVGKQAQVVKEARAKWARYTGASLQGDSLPAAIATPNGNPPLTMAYLPGFSDANDSHYYLTHWNQSYEKTSYDASLGTWPLTSLNAPLYNYYTPRHYVCGCVATAGATVLQFFNATNGVSSVTNTCSVNGEKVELTTIGGFYDWSILPENMGGKAENRDLLTEAQRELLGRATYDMGVGVGMMYTQSESGAPGAALAKAFKSIFGFATAENASVKKDDPLDKYIYNHLRAGAPVLMSIISGMSGHEVVAVGYGRDKVGGEYTRVFMGWGGASDAWYQLPKFAGYEMISDVTIKLSLDGACVPFCGQVKTADGKGVVGAEVSVPGVTNVLTGANGLFGFRLTEEDAAAVTELKVKVGGYSTTVSVAAAAGEGEEGEGEEGEGGEGGEGASAVDSLPDAVEVVLPEDVVAVASALSPDEAAKQAARSEPPRMLCVVSGREGDASTDAVKAYLAANAEAFNEKFVLYYADWNTDGYYMRDGVPSIGVFNPTAFDSSRGWSLANGRMAYVQAPEEGELLDEETIQAALDAAADAWTRLEVGVNLEVFGTYMGTEEVNTMLGPMEIKVPVVVDGFTNSNPVAGMHGNIYSNGQEVVATCQEEFTNEVEGVVYRCVGWTLIDPNAVDLEASEGEEGDGEEGEAFTNVVAEGDGTEASFTASLPDLQLEWRLERAYYRVDVSVKGYKKMPSGTDWTAADFVTSDVAWVETGKQTQVSAWVEADRTLDVVANAYEAGGYTWSFRQWEFGVEADEEEGCVASLKVTAPRAVCALFDTVSTSSLGTGSVTIGVEPAELMAVVPPTKFGAIEVAYGQEVELTSGLASFAPAETSYVDADGANWVVAGWVDLANPTETNKGARATIDLKKDAAVAFNWIWVPASGEEFETEYAIEWTNKLDNLSASYKTNLCTSAAMSAAGKTLADLTVTAPKGFKASVAESDGNVVASLALDEAVLVPALGSGLTIEPQGDGSVIVQARVVNGVKGFWYGLYSTDTLTGEWSLVAAGEFTAGVPVEQPQADGEVLVTIAVQPEAAQRFYKLKVTDVNPSK